MTKQLSEIPEKDRPAFWKRVDRIRGLLPEDRMELEVHVGYAGRDEGKDETLIVSANWNDIDRYDKRTRERVKIDSRPSRAVDAFERLGFEIEWSDGGSTCGDCNKWLETQPDSYGWTPKHVIHHDEYVCLSCLDVDDYLQEEADGRTVSCASIDPTEAGYVDLEMDYESGLHPGQDDRPEAILALLKEAEYERYFIQLTGSGQFDVQFTVFVHGEEDHARAKEILEAGDVKCRPGESPAELMQARLKSFPK